MQILNNISSNTMWWQDIKPLLTRISDTVLAPAEGQTQQEIEKKLHKIHEVYSVAHRSNMPVYIQAELIASICNLQMSYSASYEKQTRSSKQFHQMAQIQWRRFQELLKNEGVHCQILQ